MKFENSFNSTTDVIYGTGLWIHIYIYNFYFGWKSGGTPITLASQVTSTATTFDPRMTLAHNKYGTNVINLYNEPIKSTSFKMGANQKVTGPSYGAYTTSDTDMQDVAKEYMDALKLSAHYKPETLATDLDDKLKKMLGKYKVSDDLIQSGGPKNKSDRGKIVFDLYDLCIRRSCKYGVFYFTHTKGAALHYILDDMDVQSIVDKVKMINDSTNKEKIPICTSEVRYIFRHWNLLKNKRLYFYKDFETCNAPWADDQWKATFPGWADYAITRASKYRKRILKGMGNLQILNAFDEACDLFGRSRDQISARKVIEAFHNIPANLVNHPDDDTIPK